jgi:anti-sigma factor RsiW
MQEINNICPLQTDNADVLLDYCARTLDPERKAMLERHMSVCAECREMTVHQSAVWAALDEYDAEPISADFDQKLYGRIREMERVPLWQRIWAPVKAYLEGQPAWKPILPVALAACAVAVVILVRSDFGKAENGSGTTVVVQVVEQAERALEDLEMLRQFEAASSDAVTKSEGSESQKDIL